MPLKVTLFSTAMFLAVRLFGGIEYAPISLATSLFCIACLLAFVGGYYAVGVLCERPAIARHGRPIQLQPATVYRVTKILFAIGAIGILIGFVDASDKISVIQSLGMSAARVQNQLDGGRFSLLSAISQVLSYSAFSAVCLSLLYWDKLTLRQSQWHIAVICGLAAIQLTYGGRNGIVFLFANLAAVCCVRAGAKKSIIPQTPRMIKWQTSILALATVVYCGYVTVDRENLSNRSFNEMLSNIDNYFDARVNDDRFSGRYGTELYGLVFYMSHPLSSLDAIITDSGETGLYYGTLSFNKVGIALQNWGLPVKSVHDADAEVAVSGVYYPMIGTLLLDFGYLGALAICFGFGIVSRVYWQRAITGRHPRDMLIASYLVFVLFFSPFYFAISMSNGFDILVGIVITTVVFSMWGRNPRTGRQAIVAT